MSKALMLNDNQKKILEGKICPYCKKETEFVDSSEVYRESYGMIYLCRQCKAWVGVHKNSDKALGRLANRALRNEKNNAHFWFDKLWKEGDLNRSDAYAWLSEKLGIPVKYTHIGMFSAETCRKVIQHVREYLGSI